MSYPAEIDFKRDRTLSPSARRTYDYLSSTVLDFREIRVVKGKLHAHDCGINREDFSRALTQLARCGYLVEHERGPNGVRQFTLAYTVDPAKRRAG